MTLRIENETDWDGRDLRVLCRRVIEHTDGYLDRTIEVKTSKTRNKDWYWEKGSGLGGCYRGRASVGSRRFLYMGVPKPVREVDGEVMTHEFDEAMFARVLEHEIAHQRGLRHGDMIDETRYCRQELDYVDDIDVATKPSVEVPTEATPAD